MKIITDCIMRLGPCEEYPRERVKEIVGSCGTKGSTVTTLLTLRPHDARWVISNALSPENRVVWAQACADRAQAYAENTSDPIVRGEASDSAYFARTADYYAGCATEHVTLCSHYSHYSTKYAALAVKYAFYVARRTACYCATASGEHCTAVKLGVELLFSQDSSDPTVQG